MRQNFNANLLFNLNDDAAYKFGSKFKIRFIKYWLNQIWHGYYISSVQIGNICIYICGCKLVFFFCSHIYAGFGTWHSCINTIPMWSWNSQVLIYSLSLFFGAIHVDKSHKKVARNNTLMIIIISWITTFLTV